MGESEMSLKKKKNRMKFVEERESLGEEDEFWAKMKEKWEEIREDSRFELWWF